MRYTDVAKLSKTNFKRIVGVKRQTFDLMIKILSFAYAIKHEFGGKPDKLPLEDNLLIALNYWREYRTYPHIGVTYGYSESQVCCIVHWCEAVLITSGKFTVGGKRELLSINTKHLVLIDATESPIQRPKKRQKKFYSGKKKRHTIKTQLTTSLHSYATIKIEPISTIPYEYYLSILEPSPVTPVMRRFKRNDDTISMQIDEDLFIDVNNILRYKDTYVTVIDVLGKNHVIQINQGSIHLLLAKINNIAKPIKGLKDLSNMYPVDISTDVIKVHARLFLDMANLLLEKPDLDDIKNISNNLFKTYDPENSMSYEDTTKFNRALDLLWGKLYDPMIFSAITSSLVMSTLNKDSTTSQDVTNMEKISQLNLSTLPNNLNWFLDPQVIDIAKSISLRFRLSEAIKKQSDEIKMGLIFGNNKDNTIYNAALFMSNIDQNLNIARYMASTPEYREASYLTTEVIPVKMGTKDTNTPTIESSILISAFEEHPNKLEGVSVLFPKDIDLTKMLKAVYYDGNTNCKNLMCSI